MFVISDKIDKEMCPSYETLEEEKPDAVTNKETTCTPSEPSPETEYKNNFEWEYKCTVSLVKFILTCVLIFVAVVSKLNIFLSIRCD